MEKIADGIPRESRKSWTGCLGSTITSSFSSASKSLEQTAQVMTQKLDQVVTAIGKIGQSLQQTSQQTSGFEQAMGRISGAMDFFNTSVTTIGNMKQAWDTARQGLEAA